MSARKNKITPKRKLAEYLDKSLIEKKNGLWCKLCNVAIDFERKSSIDQHLETKMHKSLVFNSRNNRMLSEKFYDLNKNEIKNNFAND